MIIQNNKTEYREAKEVLKGLVLSNVKVPDVNILFNKINKEKIPSPYSQSFSFSFQRKILGLVMAVPVAIAALAVFFSFGNTGSVYLAQHDAGLEQANSRIMNNINALEELSQ